jgi:hypothetical protein
MYVVDQPAGTGFSFVNNGDPVRELAEVGVFETRKERTHSFNSYRPFPHETDAPACSRKAAEQVVVFLKNFYQVFPEFSKIDVSVCKSNFGGPLT